MTDQEVVDVQLSSQQNDKIDGLSSIHAATVVGGDPSFSRKNQMRVNNNLVSTRANIKEKAAKAFS